MSGGGDVALDGTTILRVRAPAHDVLAAIGPLDDVVAVLLLLRYAARAVPRTVLLDAWPAEPRLLERLIGSDANRPASDR